MALGIGGSIASGVQSKKAADETRKKEGIIEQQRAANDAIFNKQYYQDITQRTEIQNMLRLLDENQKKADARNAAQSAILGSTPEQELASKEATRKSYADALAELASNASSLRDKYLSDWNARQDNYFANRLNMQQDLANIKQNTSNQLASASSNAFMTGANMLGSGIDGITAGN